MHNCKAFKFSFDNAYSTILYSFHKTKFDIQVSSDDCLPAKIFLMANNLMLYARSRGMPILAHNENNIFIKKQVMMLYGIYSIKNYYYSIINTIIILWLKLYTHGRLYVVLAKSASPTTGW